MNKTILSLFAVSLLGFLPTSASLAQNGNKLDSLRQCVPETQGRYLVDSMNVIGEIPYRGGTLYHAVLNFDGQAKQVQGEVAIHFKDEKCSLIYESSYWGGGQELTEVFDRDVSRQLAYQWLAHRVEITGRDVIQNH